MRVERQGCTERLQHVHLPRRVVQVIIAANDVRDAHVHVVDDHAEVVGRRAIRARDDQVIELGVLKGHRPVHQVLDHHCAIEGIAKANDRSDAGARLGARRGRLPV